MPPACKAKRAFDRNFVATRSLFCAILEQALDDWRALQRAGRIPKYGVSYVTAERILRGKSDACDMNRKDIASLLELLTTPALDRFCAHMTAIVNPDGIRRALGISEPKLLD